MGFFPRDFNVYRQVKIWIIIRETKAPRSLGLAVGLTCAHVKDGMALSLLECLLIVLL